MATTSPRLRLGISGSLLALLLLGIGGCEAARVGLGPDDSQQPADGGPCKAGAHSCEGNNLMVCQDGSFHQQFTCANQQRCDPTFGCVDCLPSQPALCVGDTVRSCNSDGSLGPVVETCLPGACQGGKCGVSNCATGADLIYAVDNKYKLFSFNPRDDKNVFTLIGTLHCPAGQALDGSGDATPFSMSVDRMGRAWVLYNSGEVFWVSTKDASCTKSGYKPLQKGFEVFGMGFVSDVAGGSSETLFVAGGNYDTLTSANLGSVDTASLSLTKIAALDLKGQHSPELTGTGKGELYGYYPGSSAFVAQLDKTKGTILNKWSLSSMGGQPLAWAFAHWGGRFYIFINSSVYLLDPATGKATEIHPNATYDIVGAGVSTCAPIVIG